MSELWQYAVVGLSSGGAYALLALGVVAVYRGSGILNFAQGAVGMMSAYVFYAVYDQGNGSLPLAPALAIGLAVGVGLGGLFYLLVVRQLRNGSEMAKVVATLGLLLLLESVAIKIWGTQPLLLRPLFGSGTFTILGADMTSDTLVLLVATVITALGLAFLFRRTRFGMNATALRENQLAASAIGISPHPTALITWCIGGGLGALGGILLISVVGLTPDGLTELVIPAMAAALIARFTAIPTTVVVALAIGVLQSIVGGEFSLNPGVVSSLPFAVIILAVVLGGKALPTRGESLTIRLPKVTTGRISLVKLLAAVGLSVLISFALSSTWSLAIANSAIFGLWALSMVVVTGYAGQLSVGAAAFAGFASFVAARCTNDLHLPFLLCLLVGILAAIVMGFLFGAPATRVRGINLVIVTLGMTLAVEDLLLTQPSLTGGLDGLNVRSPSLFGLNVSPSAFPGRYALVCVAALTLASLAVLNIRRGVSGRRFLAVRANERGAASVGISVGGAKLGAFIVSAAIAGLAGGLATFQFKIADFSTYDVLQSVTALAYAVVGGIGFVAGAIFSGISAPSGLVANYVNNVLNFTTINDWLPIATGFFVMTTMVGFPDGAVLQFVALKDLIRRSFAGTRSLGRFVQRNYARAAGKGMMEQRLSPAAVPIAMPRLPGLTPGESVLIARDLRVTYGALVAVDDVSLELTAGRVLGVVGSNGAGKTSLIDALTGFTSVADGTVTLKGADITRKNPASRARLGLGRTFQNLELFDDLTVRENILTASDKRGFLVYAHDLFLPDRGSLNKSAEAVLTILQLHTEVDAMVADLPQGQRRMVAIARLAAQEPAAILLDEPAAGLSGAERRVASALFRSLADELGAAVLLVEHNIDVVADTCDELIVMDFGRVIASGDTTQVLRNPLVHEAYLGRSAGEQFSSASVSKMDKV